MMFEGIAEQAKLTVPPAEDLAHLVYVDMRTQSLKYLLEPVTVSTVAVGSYIY